MTKSSVTNKLGNFWFSLFLISVAVASLSGNLLVYNLDVQYPHLFKLTDLTSFAIAPSLFLAIKYFSQPERKLNKIDWFHFLPVLSFFVINGKYFLVFSSQELTTILESSPNKDVYAFVKYLLVFQCLLYLLLCLRYFYKYRNDRDSYDASNTKPLKWLFNVVIGIATMLLLWVSDSNGLFSNAIAIGYSICIYYMGFWMINQREVFPYSEENKLLLSSLLSKRNQFIEKKPNDTELYSKEKARLTNLMKTEKPYLDTDLNIFKLAKLQDSTVHELSSLINKGFNKNFNQFVNGYRVEESKKLLANEAYKNLSIVGIGYEAGFNSKTVFNSTFKKIVGKTPTEFKKHVRNYDSEQLRN